MLKATGRTSDGKPLLLLGLTGENMTRLLADEPIHINCAELGLPHIEVVIVGGRTEEAIAEQVRANGVPLREPR